MSTIRFEGNEDFHLSFGELLPKLTDATFLVRCAPEAQLLEATTDRAVMVLGPGATLLPSRLQVEVLVTTRHASGADFRIINRATGATGTAEVHITLEEFSPTTTRAAWIAEVVQVTGLLRMMPKPVLRAGVERAIPQLWKRIREALDETAGSG